MVSVIIVLWTEFIGRVVAVVMMVMMMMMTVMVVMVMTRCMNTIRRFSRTVRSLA